MQLKKKNQYTKTLSEFEFSNIYKEDIKELVKIDRICFPPEIAFNEETFDFYISDQNIIKFAAKKAKKIIGFVFILIFYEYGEIITIDVLPEFRRMGIGSKLMNEAERRMREKAVEKSILEVAVNNKPAIEFYKKLDYKILDIIPSYYPPELDAYLMGKNLS